MEREELLAMRSNFFSGMICSLFYLGAIATVNGATCSYSGSDDCGYPYHWPSARSCDPCGDCCRPMTCHDKTYCGPLTPLFALFTRDCWRGSGCRDRYWGDFYGDPPDRCDPCDRCGNYTGGWNGCNSGNGRGCNCGGDQGMVEQTVPMEGRVITQGDRVSRKAPTPASKNRKILNQ